MPYYGGYLSGPINPPPHLYAYTYPYYYPENYWEAGDHDWSLAFQRMFNAVQLTGGTVLLTGNYVISQGLVYNSAAPLIIQGLTGLNSAGAAIPGSAIVWNSPTVPMTALTLMGAYSLRLNDIGIYAANIPTNPNAGYIGILVTGVNKFGMYNVNIDNSFNPGTTIGLKVIANGDCNFDYCTISGNTHGALFTSGANGAFISGTNFTAADNVAGNAALRFEGQSGSACLNDCGTFGGDYGLHMASFGGFAPGFLQIKDFGASIPNVAGIQLDAGSQVWAEQIQIAGQGTATLNHGIVVGAAFEGTVNISHANISSASGHGMWIQGGQCYAINDSIFGGNGGFAANTYDNLHIAAAVTYATVRGTRHNIDPFDGFDPNAARSGIYIESGASDLIITDNIFAPAGYGTIALDNQGAVGSIIANNINPNAT